MSEPNEYRFDPEKLIPPAPFMRVIEFAKYMACSDTHILNLIKEGEIEVPEELKKSAPSGPSMRIPRSSLVDFVRRRSSPEWKEARRREKEARTELKRNSQVQPAGAAKKKRSSP